MQPVATGCSLQNIYMSFGWSSLMRVILERTILVTVLGRPWSNCYVERIKLHLPGNDKVVRQMSTSLHQLAIQLPIPCRFCMPSWLPCGWRSRSTVTCAAQSVSTYFGSLLAWDYGRIDAFKNIISFQFQAVRTFWGRHLWQNPESCQVIREILLAGQLSVFLGGWGAENLPGNNWWSWGWTFIC